MTLRMVRYQTHATKADENQRLIEDVFRELRAASPPGVRYLVLRLPDATFVHLVEVGQGAGAHPLTALAAFGAFQAGQRDRCVGPPQSSEVTVVGSHGMLGS